jgi:hypothetical protein
VNRAQHLVEMQYLLAHPGATLAEAKAALARLKWRAQLDARQELPVHTGEPARTTEAQRRTHYGYDD